MVVGLVRSGQMSRWIDLASTRKWGGEGEGEREVRGPVRQEEIDLERERSSWV